ncbi:MAG: pseudouridine synthase, partial [Gammaproteobacteria bacterium]|nr:pseudouridine synthase [Gammaproteobacteria bacterium]
MLLLFNKPFGVLCQFSDSENRRTLADFVDIKAVYPAGRLDRDSEGLVLLTDDGSLQHQISHPTHKMAKTYWVQVEGKPEKRAIQMLRDGVLLKDGKTSPAEAHILPEPKLWPRNPPVRYRANIPTTWIELTIKEGRNRQVRRMTAAIGHPTLRLVRISIGPWSLEKLAPGEWCETQIPENWRTIINPKR